MGNTIRPYAFPTFGPPLPNVSRYCRHIQLCHACYTVNDLVEVGYAGVVKNKLYKIAY